MRRVSKKQLIFSLITLVAICGIGYTAYSLLADKNHSAPAKQSQKNPPPAQPNVEGRATQPTDLQYKPYKLLKETTTANAILIAHYEYRVSGKLSKEGADHFLDQIRAETCKSTQKCGIYLWTSESAYNASKSEANGTRNAVTDTDAQKLVGFSSVDKINYYYGTQIK
jgi:hypothetical protein